MNQNMWRIVILLGLIGWSGAISSRAGEPKTGESRDNPLRTFTGEITDVEQVAHAITVRKFPISRRFLVAVTCKITTNDKPNAALKDLKRSDKVKVRYEEEKDGLVARQIIIRGIDEEDREEAREKEQLERH